VAQSKEPQATSHSTKSRDRMAPRALAKTPTGIRGFDELTGGGLPRGRPTLVCGGPGCGKTLFALEFLVRGALDFGEPGVFVSFEERPEDLQKNVASLGFDLEALVASKRIVVDHVRVERSEIEETGDYDLEGLFIRLGYAIDTIGAKRVVLDTIESLFSGLSNETILRAELRRLFNWLKDKGVTAIITGERGEGALTRQGLEEYVSDCVILLDNRIVGEVSTRRLRIVKYRGSTHSTNECPFLIEDTGFSLMPISSVGLTHKASSERVPSGIDRLDGMLGGEGYYRGSSILVSGGAGTGKSSIAAHLVHATCRRGEKCLYFAFEESEHQILRNMRSLGLDLSPHVKKGLLQFHASRPTFQGLEMHLALMHRKIADFEPSTVIVDPITNLLQIASERETVSMLIRLIDYLKMREVTALFTSLTSGGSAAEGSEVGVSSLMDTWLLLRNLENDGERNRGLYVLKSRGMAHSNQIREFILTAHGVKLVDVYAGEGAVLMGSARLNREATDTAAAAARKAELEETERRAARRRSAIQAQIAALQAELDDEMAALERARAVERTRLDKKNDVLRDLANRRGSEGDRTDAPARARKRNGSEERT
jgi:circadian clock protein KaiC